MLAARKCCIRALSTWTQRSRAVFDALDVDKDGAISKSDLSGIMEAKGLGLSWSDSQYAIDLMRGEPTSETATDDVNYDAFHSFLTDFYGIEDPNREIDGSVSDGLHSSLEYRRVVHTFSALFAQLGSVETSTIQTRQTGEIGTDSFRLHYVRVGKDGAEESISPWDDIPLYNPDGTLNMVVEIPKWTRAKMEIATDEAYHPIKQDIKNGKLRDYDYGDMAWNYGAFPQTWEDPSVVEETTGCVGDDDPLDVIDLGCRQYPIGSVIRVRPIGVLAMIDEGETDWKVVTMCAEDPLAEEVKTLDDAFAVLPGALEAFREWMRLYKSPTINEFAFGGAYQDAEVTRRVIQETHKAWAGRK